MDTDNHEHSFDFDELGEEYAQMCAKFLSDPEALEILDMLDKLYANVPRPILSAIGVISTCEREDILFESCHQLSSMLDAILTDATAHMAVLASISELQSRYFPGTEEPAND